jgi:hypothetical protein
LKHVMTSSGVFRLLNKLEEGFDEALKSPGPIQERVYLVVNNILGIFRDQIAGEILAEYDSIVETASSGIRATPGEWGRAQKTLLDYDEAQAVAFMQRLLAFRDDLQHEHAALEQEEEEAAAQAEARRNRKQ